MSPVVNRPGSVPPSSQYERGAPALVARMPTSSLPALFTTGDMSDPALLTVPSNHSPHYAPVPHPTLETGVTALVTAARTWLPAAA